VTLAWVAAAGVIAAANFVMGLAGFGIGVVALAFLPHLMAPADAIVLLTIYAAVFSLAMLVQLRRDVQPREIVDLFIGTVLGTPLGVWGLAALPPSALNRLIGLMLVVTFVLEVCGLYWGVGAGLLAGILGGAVGVPGPPAVRSTRPREAGPPARSRRTSRPSSSSTRR
jgi:uncharacterized membrane protein YfcA